MFSQGLRPPEGRRLDPRWVPPACGCLCSESGSSDPQLKREEGPIVKTQAGVGAGAWIWGVYVLPRPAHLMGSEQQCQEQETRPKHLTGKIPQVTSPGHELQMQRPSTHIHPSVFRKTYSQTPFVPAGQAQSQSAQKSARCSPWKGSGHPQ